MLTCCSRLETSLLLVKSYANAINISIQREANEDSKRPTNIKGAGGQACGRGLEGAQREERER
jgi:hypothetical protein